MMWFAMAGVGSIINTSMSKLNVSICSGPSRYYMIYSANPPAGWYTGRDSPNTRRLVVENGHLLYDSDYYGDDLPFWSQVRGVDGSTTPHLVVPYTLDANDMRFASAQGFNSSEQFYTYLKDSFDVLYAEGETAPKMMSVGMHCRLLGRPGRSGLCSAFWIISSNTKGVGLSASRDCGALG